MNRGAGQLQGISLRRRDQGVIPFAHRPQLQAGALQQPGEALFHPVLAGQTVTVAPIDQRRVERQVDTRLAGETGQGGAKATGWHLVAAPCDVIGPTGRDKQRTGAQAHHEAQAQ
ncbi:hypothetical protein D9M71_414490 [compost metagenome]